MMVFFLDPTGKKIYSRYGQRNGTSADALQSLAGLRHTMQQVLESHRSTSPEFAPRMRTEPKYVQDFKSGRKGCWHCHNVREAINADLVRNGNWANEAAWRFPLPETIGLSLETNRGNIVSAVKAKSSAEAAGLQKGDRLVAALGVPIRSIADLIYALDHAPSTGELPLSWQRDGQPKSASLALTANWKRSDITWRASMQRFVPAFSVWGKDLTADEKKSLGLDPKQLAFRQRDPVGTQAKAAGFLAGDVVLGIEGRDQSGWSDIELFRAIQRDYLVGDEIRLNILRSGERKTLSVKLR